MSKVIYGQYIASEYPLKHFFYNEIPDNIREVLITLSQSKIALFRGGFAFACLLNQLNYTLKDIDMIANVESLDIILETLSGADIVYINKNTFNHVVITAFWGIGEGYYKLDILLEPILPIVKVCQYGPNIIYTVSLSYIWRNRIDKISEKEKRHHSNEKTKNHYNVALIISRYLIANRSEINKEDQEEVKKSILAAKEVLEDIIDEKEVLEFQILINDILWGAC